MCEKLKSVFSLFYKKDCERPEYVDNRGSDVYPPVDEGPGDLVIYAVIILLLILLFKGIKLAVKFAAGKIRK